MENAGVVLGRTVNIERFRPTRRGESAKYSLSLYRFMKEHLDTGCKVFYVKRSFMDGSLIEFDPSNVNLSQIIIAYHVDEVDVVLGARLNLILLHGKGFQFQTFAHPIGEEDRIDITDWFRNEYASRGQCLFDPQHRYHYVGDERRFSRLDAHWNQCRWCGRKIYRSDMKMQLERWARAFTHGC